MSLALSNSISNVEVKTWGAILPIYEKTIFFGDYEISLSDFMHAAMYVLTNTDLVGDSDPRLRFLREARLLEETVGFDPNRRRLHIPQRSGARNGDAADS